MSHPADPLVIAGRTFTSRLMIGTGKFSGPQAMRAAMESSGAEIITVAVRTWTTQLLVGFRSTRTK